MENNATKQQNTKRLSVRTQPRWIEMLIITAFYIFIAIYYFPRICRITSSFDATAIIAGSTLCIIAFNVLYSSTYRFDENGITYRILFFRCYMPWDRFKRIYTVKFGDQEKVVFYNSGKQQNSGSGTSLFPQKQQMVVVLKSNEYPAQFSSGVDKAAFVKLVQECGIIIEGLTEQGEWTQ